MFSSWFSPSLLLYQPNRVVMLMDASAVRMATSRPGREQGKTTSTVCREQEWMLMLTARNYSADLPVSRSNSRVTSPLPSIAGPWTLTSPGTCAACSMPGWP